MAPIKNGRSVRSAVIFFKILAPERQVAGRSYINSNGELHMNNSSLNNFELDNGDLEGSEFAGYGEAVRNFVDFGS